MANPATESISIDNFLDNKDRPIDSPRTIEACLRTGVDTSELYPQPLESFKENSRELPALTKIKAEHYEAKRVGMYITLSAHKE